MMVTDEKVAGKLCVCQPAWWIANVLVCTLKTSTRGRIGSNNRLG